MVAIRHGPGERALRINHLRFKGGPVWFRQRRRASREHDKRRKCGEESDTHC